MADDTEDLCALDLEGESPSDKSNSGKDLLEHMRTHGWDEYGAVTHGDEVRAILGIQLPDIGTRKQFERLTLAELAAVDYCRGELLKEGKYFGKDAECYRTYLPSENVKKAEGYQRQAYAKNKRAALLLNNTPGIAQAADKPEQVRLLFVTDRKGGRSSFGRTED